MRVNGIEIKGDKFVWDGCHKIYILEDQKDLESVMELWGDVITGENLFDIKELERIWDISCPLKFISNWKLDIQYVEQFDYAIFDY